jgi:PhnB protein
VIPEKGVLDLVRDEEYLLLCALPYLPTSIECANSETKEISMSNPVRPIPEGYHSITPAITCKNAAKAIDFYKNVLGASEIMRMQGPGGMVTHAELRIGDSVIFISDEFPGMAVAPTGSGPASSYLFLYTDNVDTVFNRAVSAGCHVDMPLDNMFWGDRYGKVTDPFGHHWGLAQHVEDVAPEEMKRRSAEWSAKMAKAAGQS